MAQTCSTCRYWHKVSRTRMGGVMGECRLNPPQVFPGPEFQSDRLTVWPRTEGVDWCGRYEPKREPQPSAQKV